MAHDEVSEKLTPTAVAMACVPFPVGVRNYIVAFLNSNGTYEKHMTKLWLRKFEIGLERGVSLGGLEEMWWNRTVSRRFRENTLSQPYHIK